MEAILQNKYLVQYILIVLGIIFVFASVLIPLLISEKSDKEHQEGEV
jgi:hypothetical protein